MSRDEQHGSKAPRKGTMLRQIKSGNFAYNIPALSRFPPPEFLTDMQKNIWIATLGDIQLEFFRARHIPLMIQYVRATEHMMLASDEFTADRNDPTAFRLWEKSILHYRSIERALGFDVPRLIDEVIRARASHRVMFEDKNRLDASSDDVSGAADKRSGLMYVGH